MLTERIYWAAGSIITAGIVVALIQRAVVGPDPTLGSLLNLMAVLVLGGLGLVALLVLLVVVDDRRTRARRLDAGEGPL